MDQVLVHVSIYQGNPFWGHPIFDPLPFRNHPQYFDLHDPSYGTKTTLLFAAPYYNTQNPKRHKKLGDPQDRWCPFGFPFPNTKGVLPKNDKGMAGWEAASILTEKPSRLRLLQLRVPLLPTALAVHPRLQLCQPQRKRSPHTMHGAAGSESWTILGGGLQYVYTYAYNICTYVYIYT